MLPDWSGQTVVCIASGPSLTAADCQSVRASGHPSIVTNTTFRLCSWATALFGYDVKWWTMYLEEVRQVFTGRLFCKSPRLRNQGVEWAEDDWRFKPFGNSGACAVSLAIAAGASKVVMLGYDADTWQGSHHHGDHPAELSNCASAPAWPTQFGRLAAYTKKHNVTVVNASRYSDLKQFERMPLEACL